MTTQTTTTESRRDRQRAATEAEIRGVARRQLAAHGMEGVSLRGIAREMGMTAPALYRYFASLDDLVEALCADLFGDVSDAISAALDDAGEDLGARMHAAIRAFRRWAVDHPAEFSMMFSREHGELHGDKPDEPLRFAALFFELFLTMWRAQPFPVPPADELNPAACAQLADFAGAHGVDVEPGALWVFARSWVRLYGVICMEVLGQLGFMFSDVQPYFEAELAAVAREVGIAYVPPA